MLDHPLGEGWKEERSNSAAGKNQRERESAVAVKPCEDGARVGKLGGAVRYQTNYEVSEIVAPYVRPKGAERGKRRSENQNRR